MKACKTWDPGAVLPAGSLDGKCNSVSILEMATRAGFATYKNAWLGCGIKSIGYAVWSIEMGGQR